MRYGKAYPSISQWGKLSVQHLVRRVRSSVESRLAARSRPLNRGSQPTRRDVEEHPTAASTHRQCEGPSETSSPAGWVQLEIEQAPFRHHGHRGVLRRIAKRAKHGSSATMHQWDWVQKSERPAVARQKARPMSHPARSPRTPAPRLPLSMDHGKQRKSAEAVPLPSARIQPWSTSEVPTQRRPELLPPRSSPRCSPRRRRQGV